MRDADGTDNSYIYPNLVSNQLAPTPFVVPRTFHVVTLSAHQLVTERRWENMDIGDGYYVPTSYLTTDTYTR